MQQYTTLMRLCQGVPSEKIGCLRLLLGGVDQILIIPLKQPGAVDFAGVYRFGATDENLVVDIFAWTEFRREQPRFLTDFTARYTLGHGECLLGNRIVGDLHEFSPYR